MSNCQRPLSEMPLKTCNTNLRHLTTCATGPSRRLLSAVVLGAAISIITGGFSPLQAANGNSAFLVPQRSISQPPGSLGLCSKYTWACAKTGQSKFHENAALRLAKAVNSKVNRRTRQIGDRAQYGREEYWNLPTSRGGDCEDLVLLKKKLLVEAGMTSERLLISTVLDRKMNSHAVLVFRTKRGDFILDSLTSKILSWKDTGYTFLKMQNPASLGDWDAVLAGGVIKDRPTASK
jgi:predicted transglutaminase-like cysteine proteinase